MCWRSGALSLLCVAAGVMLLPVTAEAAAARRVSVRAADGVVLTGAYYEPARRPAPGIVLVHMLRRSHADWDATASELADAGFAVIALDLRGDDVASMWMDVRAAKAFLRERPEVVPTSIGIAGASVGANAALLEAADDPGVKSVALLSPGDDYRGLRAEAAMKKYGGRPALLAGSRKDPYVWRSIRHLAAIGPGVREVRLTDAVAHGTVLLARDTELTSALVDWFKRTLV
jgi:dienelactone hydrolase